MEGRKREKKEVFKGRAAREGIRKFVRREGIKQGCTNLFNRLSGYPASRISGTTLGLRKKKNVRKGIEGL